MNLPQTPSFSLANKNALVVGASSGIGLACAVALADYGAKVTLAARRTKKIKELAEKLNNKGCDASILDFDISNLDQLNKIIEIAFKAKINKYLIESANPRHAHEWKIFEYFKSKGFPPKK